MMETQQHGEGTKETRSLSLARGITGCFQDLATTCAPWWGIRLQTTAVSRVVLEETSDLSNVLAAVPDSLQLERIQRSTRSMLHTPFAYSPPSPHESTLKGSVKSKEQAGSLGSQTQDDAVPLYWN